MHAARGPAGGRADTELGSECCLMFLPPKARVALIIQAHNVRKHLVR